MVGLKKALGVETLEADVDSSVFQIRPNRVSGLAQCQSLGD